MNMLPAAGAGGLVGASWPTGADFAGRAAGKIWVQPGLLQLASELGADVTVVDERPSALQKLHHLLKAAQGRVVDGRCAHLHRVTDMAALDEIAGPFDLCISSEVVQRLDPAERGRYAARLAAWARPWPCSRPTATIPPIPTSAAFPALPWPNCKPSLPISLSPTLHFKAGYIDMPPFPPGITRSDEQREQATSGRMEALAMWGLGYYARAEKLLPTAVRRSKSHIVFILVQREP
ncbi:MAG: class I SAM-dependent methyltransferase [Chloroflexi bacterium]|nr:class I SAM-dependent methyltransferase [Chloroflexota bacterium]